MKEFLEWKNVAGLESRKSSASFLRLLWNYVMLVCNVSNVHIYVLATSKYVYTIYVGGSGPTKGHLISEQICKDIDFPKLQQK